MSLGTSLVVPAAYPIMMFLKIFVGFSLASIALGSPLQLNARQNSSSPCAQVSASVATQTSVATPTVPAQLAYDCITSVPLNKSAALTLIDTIIPYIRWQSNTVWLKDPPAEYAEKVQPGVDVLGGIQDIQSKVEDESYGNEFEVCPSISPQPNASWTRGLDFA